MKHDFIKQREPRAWKYYRKSAILVMGAVAVVFYRDERGTPGLEWLKGLGDRAYIKGVARIERLAALGHELRRPEADYLNDGVYELRWKVGHVQFRLLYFFHGREAVVLSHGLTKEGKVPDKDIDLAIWRKASYLENPKAHTTTRS